MLWAGVVMVAMAIGAGGVRLGVRRNICQPIEQDPESEQELIRALERYPEQWLRVEEVLKASHFGVPGLKERYERLEGLIEATWLGEMRYRGTSDPEMEERILSVTAHESWEELIEYLGEQGIEVGGASEDRGAVKEQILELGGKVAGNGMGREQNSERSKMFYDDVEKKIVRLKSGPNPRRMVVWALLSALAALVGVGVLGRLELGWSGWAFGAISLASLIFGSVELSSVDIDTMYLDNAVFSVSGIISWLGLVGLAVTSHHPFWLVAGVTMGVAVAVMFELMSRIYGSIRGVTQGAGDTLIVLVSVGVPAGLTHSWQVGLYSVLAGCLLMIVSWSVMRVRKLVTKASPVAFGPYLAAGWVVALGWWLLAKG